MKSLIRGWRGQVNSNGIDFRRITNNWTFRMLPVNKINLLLEFRVIFKALWK